MLIACRLFLMILLSVFTLSAARAADDNQNTLLVFGDSLSAAYGMDARQGWVAYWNKDCNKPTRNGSWLISA